MREKERERALVYLSSYKANNGKKDAGLGVRGDGMGMGKWSHNASQLYYKMKGRG